MTNGWCHNSALYAIVFIARCHDFHRKKNKNSEIQFSNPTWPIDLFFWPTRPVVPIEFSDPTRRPIDFRLNPSNTGQNAIIHIICEATCIRVSIPNMDTHINIKLANGWIFLVRTKTQNIRKSHQCIYWWILCIIQYKMLQRAEWTYFPTVQSRKTCILI